MPWIVKHHSHELDAPLYISGYTSDGSYKNWAWSPHRDRALRFGTEDEALLVAAKEQEACGEIDSFAKPPIHPVEAEEVSALKETT